MESSSENMDSSGEGYGSLLFFRKDGAYSLPYPLSEGQNTVGSSSDADVRLKINDDCLEKIHCVVEVNENGIATIVNKSIKAPVKVNGVVVRKYKVLNDKDNIEIVGKKCQYVNENISIEELQKNEKYLAKKVVTPSSNRRRTVAPLLQAKSAKKSPSLITKTPVQVQRIPLKRKSEGDGIVLSNSVTPEKRLDQRSLVEKSKTTSKLVVSKALGANTNITRRRLSLGSGPRKMNKSSDAGVSVRNIKINKNTITSMIAEEEERPSLSMKQISTPVNKKLESLKSNLRSPVRKSLASGYNSPRKSILKNTPKKAELTTEDDSGDLLTKTVSFSNVKAANNDKEDKKSLGARNSVNRRSGILKSDETEYLRLSSTSSISPLKTDLSEDSLFSYSETESPKNPKSRLSLRKSMENQSEKPSSRRSRLSLAKTNLAEYQNDSRRASKARISSRSSIHTPMENTKVSTSEDASALDNVNKSDSSIDSMNFELSPSNSPNRLSTSDIKDTIVTSSVKKTTTRERGSILETVSTDKLSRVSGRRSIRNRESLVSNPSLLRNLAMQSSDDEVSARKGYLGRSGTLNSSAEENVSLAEEMPLSPIRPVSRRSSMRKSVSLNNSTKVKKQDQQSSLSLSYESIGQDEEDALLDTSGENQFCQSELGSSFEESREEKVSFTAEEPPPSTSRRSSVRKSYTVDTLSSSRRSSSKILDKSAPDDDKGRTPQSNRSTSTVNVDQITHRDQTSNRSLRYSRNSTSRNQNDSCSSLGEDFECKSDSFSEANGDSSSRSFEENLTPDLKNTSPQQKGRSSIKPRESLDDLQENTTSSRENIYSTKNRKSSLLDPQQDSNLPLEGTTSVRKSRSSIKERKSLIENLPEDRNLSVEHVTPVPENVMPEITPPIPRQRSSVRGRKSLIVQEDLTLPVEHQSLDIMNDSSKKSRKSSLANLAQDKMSPLDSETPVPMRRSSKGRKASVGDLQKDSTLPVDYEMTDSKDVSPRNSVRDLHENSTLPIQTPESNGKHTRKSGKSSLGNLQDSTLPLEGQTPVPKIRSSVKSRKSSIYNLHEDSTLPMEDTIPDSKNVSLRKRRKTSIGSVSPLESQTPDLINRSSVKSRLSSMNQFHENSTLPYESHQDHGEQSSPNYSHEESTLPIEEKKQEIAKSRKSSVNVLRETSIIPLESQKDLRVTLNNETPELTRSSVKIRDSSIREGALPAESGTPQPSRRSSRTPKPSLRYSTQSAHQSSVSQSDKLIVSLDKSEISVSSRSFSVSDNDESLQEKTLERNLVSASNTSLVDAKTPVPYRRSVRSSKFGESYTVSVAHSTLNEDHSSLMQYNDSSIEDSRAETPQPSRRSSFRRYKSEVSVDSRDLDLTRETTPDVSRRSSRRAVKSELFSDESHLSTRSETPQLNRSHSVRGSATKAEAISMSETLDSTPENNTSIVFIDTPLDESRKPGHSRLSKTIYSKIEEVDLTTPKSAIKSRRGKSLPYRPETEDITLVSPMEENESESGFKTPLTTPGLFENIRKSVIKSRSRMQKSSNSLREELEKAKSAKKSSKRPRESNESTIRQHKRRKLVINEDDSFESYDGSFGSFESDEALSDISASIVAQDTPSHLSNLTEKPVITHPRTRFSTIEKITKRQSSRRSLPASAMTFEASGSETSEGENLEEKLDESSEEVDQAQKSPENDLTNITGVRRLMKTPRLRSSPKNDLSDIKGTKKLFATPKVTKSPKNDLTNIVGVKKLLATPRDMKSPKNDLSNIIGVKKLLATPKDVKSPRNDLTQIVGVKKLLATPKEMKSPKNDLTHIPNLRKIMSPKYQNSPMNDLSDLRGVKKLLGTPKESKGPLNDLSDLRGVKKLLGTPRESKEPLNELSDLEGVAEIFNISGIHRLSNTSDIENNEDLFDKLMDRRPLRTYKGKSLSPKKTIDSYGDKRKTLGDKSDTSPRVEDWVNEQAVIKLRRMNDLTTGDKASASGVDEDAEEPPTKGKKKTRVEKIKEESVDSPPRRGGRRKAATEESLSSDPGRTKNKVEPSTPSQSPVRKITRGRSKKALEVQRTELEEIDSKNSVEKTTESNSIEVNAVESPRATRGRRKAVVIEEKPVRGRRKAPNQTENQEETEEVVKAVVEGKKMDEGIEKSEDSIEVSNYSPKTTTRGRRKVMIDSPVVEKVTRSKRKIVEEISEESDAGNISESTQKAARGKRKKLLIDVEKFDEPATSVESPSTTSPDKKDIDKELPVIEKTTRGRKKAVEREIPLVESSNSVETLIDSPKLQTRGRRNPKEVEKEILDKPKRGKKKVENTESKPSRDVKPIKGKGKLIDESSEEAVGESFEIIEFKKPISRKNTKESVKSEDTVLSSEAEETDTYVPKKTTRGTRKVQKLEDVPVESPKPTRGRRKIVEVVESTTEDTKKIATKGKKGRNDKVLQSEDSKLLVLSTIVEDEISSAQVDSTTGDFSPVPSEDLEEETVFKIPKGKKTKLNVAIEVDEKLNDEPSKRPRRGRKVSSDEALNVMEAQVETKVVEAKKVTKAKSRKELNEEPNNEEENSRTTRGGRQQKTEEISNTTTRKQTRGKKQNEGEENVQPVKATRGRRPRESEDTEVETGRKTRKNKKVEEEEVPVESTKKAGRSTKNKALSKVNDGEINSPTTRAVKGNFNKYGSSFETESPGKPVGRKKKVHFV